MEEEQVKKNYSEYVFEDFLQDDFFIASIKNPTDESVLFWNKLLEEKEINPEEFKSAKRFITEITEISCNNCISDPEISALWENIDNSNRKGKNILKRILYYSGYAAASIAIAILSVFYLAKDKNSEKDIVSFARENKVDDNSSEIQIVLSDHKTLQLTNEESDIVYDSTGIKIAENSISRKESAEYNRLIVPKGKRLRLTLADGTTMHVNSGTRVIYPVEFTGNKREIYVDGEVFISVTYDAKRPFIVKTKDLNIQVLGTTFNVMAYEADRNKQVVLVEGSVKVCNPETGGIMLSPSQMYETDNDKSEVKNVDITKYTSWVNGLYLFESENLETVLTRLSRYYGTDIIFSKEAASLKCSGKMDLKDNLKDILNGLSFSFPVKIEYENGKYNITKSV